MRFFKKLLGGFVLAWSVQVAHAAQIAIVIDDIGYKVTDKQLLDMDAQLTYAVLPHTPLGATYAEYAAQRSRDVIIHLPMQAKTNNRLLGKGALTHRMSKRQYQSTLLSALEDIPFAVGVNNHMGSLLTSQEQPMAWTMELLRQHNMFFLDSKTTRHSKIEKVATEYGVDSLERNVFLDHNRSKPAIEWQFKRLVKLAKHNGQAIAIGHPYRETMEVLQEKLAQLDDLGVELVPLSHLLIHEPYLVKTENKRPPAASSNSSQDFAPQ